MTRKAFARADKDERRRVILTTAARLFNQGDGCLPCVAQIAHASNLAKGTVYLYFTTKGAIFAALQAEGWGGLRDAVDRVTAATTGSREASVAEIITGFVDYLRAHPELLRLDALSYGVIEPNMAPAELATFKNDQMIALAASAGRLDQALKLYPGKSLQILLRSYALVRGLWQSFPLASASADTQPPSTNFHVELADALREYWRGALA